MAATARRARKVIERERRPPQLEVDRLDARRALEIPEREPRHRQRPSHLVLRPRRQHHPPAPARVQRTDDEDPREMDHHAATPSSTGPSTRR